MRGGGVKVGKGGDKRCRGGCLQHDNYFKQSCIHHPFENIFYHANMQIFLHLV